MNTYGITYNGTHTDVSRTEKGAKNFASRNGYNFVSVRYNGSCNAQIIAEKVNGIWKPI